MEDLFNLKKKVAQYLEVLDNTDQYRKAWKTELASKIQQILTEIAKETNLPGEVTCKENMENLEAVELSLGQSQSGIFETINDQVHRHLIKHNGSLIYQQLFNGKIIVVIHYPYIENYGQPRPPKTIAIYRPEEIKTPYIIRHVEQLLTEITNWEDFDDDEPNQKIGFKMNFSNNEGFQEGA